MDIFNQSLLPGEELICVKKAAPFKLMEEPFKRGILLSTLIKLIVWVGFIGYYLYNAQVQHFAGETVAKTTAVLGLIAAVMLLYPLIDKRRLEKHSRFAITNARVMTFAGESLLRFMSLEDVTEVKIVPLSNGASILLINEACHKRLSRARSLAFTGIRDDADQVTGLVLYSIEDPHEFCRYFPNLRQQVDVSAPKAPQAGGEEAA